MEREVAQRQAKLQAQGWFEHQEALTLAYQGRLKEAAQLSDRAVSLARQAGLRERAAQFEGARAAWSALFGIREEGQRSAAAALSLYRGRDADYGPAFALALLHDSGSSSARSRRNSKSGTRRTHRSNSVTCLRCGRSRLSTRDDPAKALEMTQAGRSVRTRCSGHSVLHRRLLRSAVSGLRAWPRLFPDGPPSRGSG